MSSSSDGSPNVSISSVCKRKPGKNIGSPTKRFKNKKCPGFKRDYNSLKCHCNQLIPGTSNLVIALLFMAGYSSKQSLATIKDVTIIAIQNSVMANINRLEGVNDTVYNSLKDQKTFEIEVGSKQSILALAKQAQNFLIN